MKTTTSTSAKSRPRKRRYDELKRVLEERRREIDNEIRGQLALVRAEREAADHVGARDDGEVADVDVQEDVALALVQMRRETIGRIDAALARLNAGEYGRCTGCGRNISEVRLRALPFAVRCVECEEDREAAAGDRQLLKRHLPLFSESHGQFT